MNQIRPWGIATLENNYGALYFFLDIGEDTFDWMEICKGGFDYIEQNKQKYFDDALAQIAEWEKTNGMFPQTTTDMDGKETTAEVFVPKKVYVKPIVSPLKTQVDTLKERIVVLEEDNSTTKLQVEALEVLTIGVEEKPVA